MRIKVIQQVPQVKDAEILDKEGIELLFKKAQDAGLVLERENQLKIDTSEITFFKNKPGCVINTFWLTMKEGKEEYKKTKETSI